MQIQGHSSNEVNEPASKHPLPSNNCYCDDIMFLCLLHTNYCYLTVIKLNTRFWHVTFIARLASLYHYLLLTFSVITPLQRFRKRCFFLSNLITSIYFAMLINQICPCILPCHSDYWVNADIFNLVSMNHENLKIIKFSRNAPNCTYHKNHYFSAKLEINWPTSSTLWSLC